MVRLEDGGSRVMRKVPEEACHGGKRENELSCQLRFIISSAKKTTASGIHGGNRRIRLRTDSMSDQLLR